MCDCLNKLNNSLEKEGSNTRIYVPYMITFSTGQQAPSRALIVTEKADPKKRESAKKFFATFCPFCGERYEQPQKEEEKEKSCEQ